MAKKVIIKTEEELKELTIFDILHDIFGITIPRVENIPRDITRAKARGKRGIEGNMVFIKFSEEEDEITIKDESPPEKV